MSQQEPATTNGDAPPPYGTPAPALPNALWPVMAATSLVAVAALLSTAVIATKGGEASTPIIVSILGFAATLTGVLLTVVKTQQVGEQMRMLHVAVDGRLTQLLKSNTAAATAQGRATGHAAGMVDQRAGSEEERLARAVAAALKLLAEEQATALLKATGGPVPVVPVPTAPIEVVLTGTTAPVPVVIADTEKEG